jgi:hypothetical protein
MALLPANRTRPLPPYIALGPKGSAAKVLRGSTVTDIQSSSGVRRPPGATTTTLALSQKTLSVAQASQQNHNLKLSPRV